MTHQETPEVSPTGAGVGQKAFRFGAAGAGGNEWTLRWGAPAPGTGLRRVSRRSMEDDAPVIYGLEFQVGDRRAQRRRCSRGHWGFGGPEALVIQDGPGACVTHGGRSGSARDPPAWEPPPPPLSPGRSLWPKSHHSLRCICLCTFPPALAFLEACTLFFSFLC